MRDFNQSKQQAKKSILPKRSYQKQEIMAKETRINDHLWISHAQIRHY